jgi:hypothetical protein
MDPMADALRHIPKWLKSSSRDCLKSLDGGAAAPRQVKKTAPGTAPEPLTLPKLHCRGLYSDFSDGLRNGRSLKFAGFFSEVFSAMLSRVTLSFLKVFFKFPLSLLSSCTFGSKIHRRFIAALYHVFLRRK